MVEKIARTLNLVNGDAQVLLGLEKKLQNVFQDDSQKIFEYSEDQLKQFVENNFKPKCIEALKQMEDADEDRLEMFIDNIDQADFLRFLRAIVKL